VKGFSIISMPSFRKPEAIAALSAYPVMNTILNPGRGRRASSASPALYPFGSAEGTGPASNALLEGSAGAGAWHSRQRRTDRW
jgi:hypothetical protein